MFTSLLGQETARTKRRLYPTCVCYHGCVAIRSQALTFRESLGDIKAHVRSLKRAGYQIVSVSQYKAWQAGTMSFDHPVTCLHFDDCLESLNLIVPWLIAQGIPCGLAIISRRLGAFDSENGFSRWDVLRGWVATGLVEVMSHTHNMHHLTLRISDVTGTVDTGPVLEGPCWIDDGDVVYREPGDPRWFWEFSHVDTTTLGLPLWGTDPYDEATPIITHITMVPRITASIAVLRLWMALGKPSGAGYDAAVQIRANGVLVWAGVIYPKHYETRDQWVEREFYSITLDTAFGVTNGSSLTLEFKTLNAGKGAALLYGIATSDSTRFYSVTNCKGLFLEGSQGPPNRVWQYSDYPANTHWSVKPCLILGTGTGREATVAEYEGYVAQDCDRFNFAIANYLNASWSFANLPFPDSDETITYGPFVIVNGVSNWNPSVLSIYVGSTETVWLNEEHTAFNIVATIYCHIIPYQVATVPAGETTLTVPGLMPYTWTYGEFFIGGAKYTWSGISNGNTLTNITPALPSGASNITVTGAADKSHIIGWANPTRVHGVFRLNVTSTMTVETLSIKVSNAERFPGGDSWYAGKLADEAVLRSYSATFAIYIFAAGGQGFVHVGDAAIWRIAKGLVTDITPITLPPGTTWILIDPINDGPTAGTEQHTRWEVKSLNLGVRSTASAPPVPDQIIYPFGSYYSDGDGVVQQKPGFKDIGAGLKAIFTAHGLTHGYTIQAVRNVAQNEWREPDLRQTQYALGRWLVYGDQDPRVSINNLAATSGYLLPDVHHHGVRWQVSMEADAEGNASIRQRTDVLDYVAFDAWYFDGAGHIVPSECNDGGTYAGVTYPDDRAWLRARGVRCLLIINNNAGTGDPDPVSGSHVVNNPDIYVPLVVAAANGWDGITCNLEALPATDRTAASNFYRQLATAMHAAGKLLHATMPATTGTDYDAPWWTDWCDYAVLAKACDAVKVMTYTETGPGTDPGPAAPQVFWDQVYDYTRRVIPEPYWPRVHCGCRAFGHLWTTGNTIDADYLTYHEFLEGALSYGKNIEVRDTEVGWGNGTYTAWCGSPATLERSQLEAVKSGFGGIGLWKLDDGDIEEFIPPHRQIGVINMVAFVEQRFPVEYSWGAEGGPKFRTHVIASDAGLEGRVQTWQFPLCSYKLTRDLFNQTDHERLMAFWRLMGGRAIGFRFRDWMDYSAKNQTLGTADGVVTNFQLLKAYTFVDDVTGVSQTVQRPIKKPVPNTLSMALNGVLQSTGWSVNTATGLVSFLSPPAAGVVVSAVAFEFDVPVRFAQDDLNVVVDKSYNTYSWSMVGFEEVRQS
jgi:uncharacterized protein (TIGR02217 family)